MRGLLAVALLLAVMTVRSRAWAVCTTSAATITTVSTQIIAAHDLANGLSPGRHSLSCTNNGPDVVYIGIGTSNAVTAANGTLTLIGETLNWPQMAPANAPVTAAPDGDVSAISYNGGGNTTANVVCCDY